MDPDSKKEARNRALLTGVGILAAAAAVHHFWPKGIIYGDEDEAYTRKKETKEQQQQRRPRRFEDRGSARYDDDDDDVEQVRRSKSVSRSRTLHEPRSDGRHNRRPVSFYEESPQGPLCRPAAPVVAPLPLPITARSRENRVMRDRKYVYGDDDGRGSSPSGSGSGAYGSSSSSYSRGGYAEEEPVYVLQTQQTPRERRKDYVDSDYGYERRPVKRRDRNRYRIEDGFDR